MEKLHVNDIFLEKIKTLIYENKNEILKKELINFHYADIAEIIKLISLDEAIHIVKLLESDITAEALAEVDESFREKILNKLSAKEIAEEIEELDTDDAADIVGELPEILQEKVLSKIKKLSGHKNIITTQGSGSTVLEMVGLNFLRGKVLIISTGYYSDTLVNSVGCDSIAYLDLTINYSSIVFDTITACDSLFW